MASQESLVAGGWGVAQQQAHQTTAGDILRDHDFGQHDDADASAARLSPSSHKRSDLCIRGIHAVSHRRWIFCHAGLMVEDNDNHRSRGFHHPTT
jgi:hypothetical protein